MFKSEIIKCCAMIMAVSVIHTTFASTYDYEVVHNIPGVTWNGVAVGDINPAINGNEIAVALYDYSINSGASWVTMRKGDNDYVMCNEMQGHPNPDNTFSGMANKIFYDIGIGDIDPQWTGNEIVTLAHDAGQNKGVVEEYSFAPGVEGNKGVVKWAPTNCDYVDIAIADGDNYRSGIEIFLAGVRVSPSTGGGELAEVRWNGSAWESYAVGGQTGMMKDFYGVDVGNADSSKSGNEVSASSTDALEVFHSNPTTGAWVGDVVGVIGMPTAKILYSSVIGDVDDARIGHEVLCASQSNVESVNKDANGISWINDVLPSGGVSKNNTVAVGRLGVDSLESVVIAHPNDLVIRFRDFNGIWQNYVLEISPDTNTVHYTCVTIGDLNGDKRNDVIFGRSDGVLGAYLIDKGSKAVSLEFQNPWPTPPLTDPPADQEYVFPGVPSVKYQGLENYPEGCISYFNYPDGLGNNTHMWFTGAASSYYMRGTDINNLSAYPLDGSGNAVPVLTPTLDCNDCDQGFAGITSVLYAYPGNDPNNLIAFYHAENHCWSNSNWSGMYGVIALATSSDGGITWTRQGVVVDGADPKPDFAAGPLWPLNGAEIASVVPSPDGKYLYMYYSEKPTGYDPCTYDPDNDVRGCLALARADITTDGMPGNWYKYKDGSFSEPGLGNYNPSPVIDVPGDYDTYAKVTYNNNIGRYIAVFCTSIDWWTAESYDGIHWRNYQHLLNCSQYVYNNGPAYFYLQILDPSTGTHLEIDENPYLYMGYTQWGSDEGGATYPKMARRPMAVIPPTINPANIEAIDTIVDFVDFASLTASWLLSGSDLEADIYWDDIVNGKDLELMVKNWLAQE